MYAGCSRGMVGVQRGRAEERSRHQCAEHFCRERFGKWKRPREGAKTTVQDGDMNVSETTQNMHCQRPHALPPRSTQRRWQMRPPRRLCCLLVRRVSRLLALRAAATFSAVSKLHRRQPRHRRCCTGKHMARPNTVRTSAF